MRVLLLGGTGLLGRFLQSELSANAAFTVWAPTRAEMDLTNTSNFLKLSNWNPQLIINAAGYTDVEGAEKESELCQRLNVGGVQSLLSAKVPLVHFSSDYVFGNDGSEPLPEDFSDFQPRGVYARSKFSAENLLNHAQTPWWNFRTSWLFGAGKKNFVDTIAQRLINSEPTRVVADQFGRPTDAPELARVIVQHFSAEKWLPAGHYHLTSGGAYISWYQLALRIAKILGTNADLIQPIGTEEWASAVDRPRNSRLENNKLPELKSWEESLEEYLGKD